MGATCPDAHVVWTGSLFDRIHVGFVVRREPAFNVGFVHRRSFGSRRAYMHTVSNAVFQC